VGDVESGLKESIDEISNVKGRLVELERKHSRPMERAQGTEPILGTALLEISMTPNVILAKAYEKLKEGEVSLKNFAILGFPKRSDEEEMEYVSATGTKEGTAGLVMDEQMVRQMISSVTGTKSDLTKAVKITAFKGPKIFRLEFIDGEIGILEKLLSEKARLKSEFGGWIQRDAPRELRQIISNAHQVAQRVKEQSQQARKKFYSIEDGMYVIGDVEIAHTYLLPSTEENRLKFMSKLDEELSKRQTREWKSRHLQGRQPLLEEFCLLFE
jgi:hypothetical protein